MPTILSTAITLLPYHLLAYGTLLGMQVWHSNAVVRLSYIHLAPTPFQNLQRKTFPVYFRTQLGLTLLTLVTVPPLSIANLVSERWGSLVTLSIAAGMSALNLWVYSPRSTKAMVTRAEIGKKHGEKSEEFTIAKKAFSRNHAMSIHFNLISLIATTLYGFMLASKLIVVI